MVIQSYRHRFGYAAGDPAFEKIEKQLAKQPPIPVPTIVLHGDGDGVAPADSSVAHASLFTGPYERRVIPVIGHNPPQEAPEDFAAAVIELCRA